MNWATTRVRIVTFSLATLAMAGANSVQHSCGQEKSILPEHFVLGEIRVFYTIEGPSAVPLADVDSSGTPDHVEDVAKQVWAAHQLFCGVSDFPDPFQSERYPGLTCIEVRIWDRNEIGGVNGVAFSASQRARRVPEGNENDRAIVMSIGKHVDARKNITPAHELFHHIQYGATYFKRSWFLEGQTRWSEHALALGGLGDVKYSPRGPWPQPATVLPALFESGPDAEFVLWNPIAIAADPRGVLPQTELLKELASLRYSDGSPVLTDMYLAGADIMREILIELGKMDDVAFTELGYDQWTDDATKSSQNDAYMYKAIMEVLLRSSQGAGRDKVAGGSRVSGEGDAWGPDERVASQVTEGKAGDDSNAAAIEAAKWRIWTTADGKYKVKAKFLKYAAGSLTLEREDGATVDVRLNILCTDDQAFVTQQKWMGAAKND